MPELYCEDPTRGPFLGVGPSQLSQFGKKLHMFLFYIGDYLKHYSRRSHWLPTRYSPKHQLYLQQSQWKQVRKPSTFWPQIPTEDARFCRECREYQGKIHLATAQTVAAETWTCVCSSCLWRLLSNVQINLVVAQVTWRTSNIYALQDNLGEPAGHLDPKPSKP